VYGKTGAWEEAIRVLDALEAQGIDPEIRTYNTGGWGSREVPPALRSRSTTPPTTAATLTTRPLPALRSHHCVQHERPGAGGSAHL
jgi:hypothetical protein